MTRTTKPRFTRNVLSAFIAAIGLAATPLAWAADSSGELELGLGNVSRDSAKFGTFNGLNESGVYGIANIRMLRRGDGNDASYFEIEGRNLGLRSRSLSIGGGEQGNFGLRLEYTEIPKFESDSYMTPYLGAGSTRLTQPAGLVDGLSPGGSTVVVPPQGMAGLAASMRTFEVGTQRNVLGLGLTKVLPAGWDLAFNVKRDVKDGTKLRGAAIQVGTGGSRGVVIVPEVVDYTTDMVDAFVRYDGGKLQLQFGYYGSFFNNAHNAMTWDNLFTGAVTVPSSLPNTTGRYALAPDNQFHQINASGGYVFSPMTRLSGNLSLGRMTQNDPFLPYSTGGARPATASLDGKVDTTHASVKLTSRLMPVLNLVAGYKYDDRDNRTAVNQYDYLNADRDTSAPIAPATYATSSMRRRNTPLSSTSHKAYADLDYSLTKATKLKLGYDYHQVSHTYEPTTKDVEHTVKAEVKHKFTDTASGGLSYSYSERNADTYRGEAPLAATYAPGYLATLVGATKSYPWLEAPFLRKFFLDDRKRDKVGVVANIAPTDSLDLRFGLDYREDRHPEADAGYGLSKVNSWAANFDAGLRFTGAVTGHVFATLEEYTTDQKGTNLTTGLAMENNTVPAANRWMVSIRDRIYTLGLGLRVKPGGKYEWGGDLIHASSNGATSFAAGSAVAAGPLPDLITRRNRLELFGRYAVQKDLSVNVKYIYERYHSTDWGYDTLTLTSFATGNGGVVGTNQISPTYSVHVIGVSAAYRFR